MKIFKAVFLIGISFFLLFIFSHSISKFCHAEVAAYQGTHILTYKTMAQLAKVFKEKTGMEIKIRGGGCHDGIMGVLQERYDMGGICCPMRPGELKKYHFVAYLIAHDIKAVIVNKKNPLDNLSADQLKNIHFGRIRNWEELGWKKKPVALVYRKHCPDMEEPVRKFLGIDDSFTNLSIKAIVVRTDKELIEYVAKFPTAIGVTSKVFASGKSVKIINVDGVSATAKNVRSERYKFTGPLFIITKGAAQGATKRFLDFALSPAGQAIINENLAGIK